MFPRPVVESLPENLRWECVRVDKGKWVEGFLAGSVEQVACHWSGRASKPCHAFISGGKLPCHCQDKPASLRVVAYVPLITKDKEKIVVPAAPTVGYLMERKKLWSPVRLARPDRDKKPLVVIDRLPADLNEQVYNRLKHVTPHDISEYLLHLWQEPILNVFFGIDHRPASITPLMRPEPEPNQ